MPESEYECPISSELQHSEATFGFEDALPVSLQALVFWGKFLAVPEGSEHILHTPEDSQDHKHSKNPRVDYAVPKPFHGHLFEHHPKVPHNVLEAQQELQQWLLWL